MRERGRAQQRPLFAGVQFRYGRHLKRTSSSSFRLPRKNDSERERGREGVRRRQIPISGPESPEHKRHRMWQSDMLICCWITFSLSLLRTLAMHFNYAHFRARCGRVRQLPQDQTVNHKLAARATKLEGGEKGRPSWAEAPLCG